MTSPCSVESQVLAALHLQTMQQIQLSKGMQAHIQALIDTVRWVYASRRGGSVSWFCFLGVRCRSSLLSSCASFPIHSQRCYRKR